MPPVSLPSPTVALPADMGLDIVCVPALPSAAAGLDLLAVPCFEEDELADLAALDPGTAHDARRAREWTEFRGHTDELVLVPLSRVAQPAPCLALAGLGRRDTLTPSDLRRAAAAVGVAARRRRWSRIGFLVRDLAREPERLRALVEGLVLAQFQPAKYKGAAGTSAKTAVQLLIADGSPAQDAAVARGQILGHFTNVVRELVNEPANLLTPCALADRAVQLAIATGLRAEVLDENAMAALQMGLLLGVAGGSVQPPRLIALHYDPPGRAAGPILGLVGKGITFDGGGLATKRPADLEFMKYDMAGGAAVIGAMCAIGVLKPAIRVIGVIPAAENMPGGGATRPGDVLTSAAGTSVEVVNPDAEGRLILADALWYARQLGATHLVDIATLTGACIAALGEVASGLLGSPDEWLTIVREVAEREGERVWPLPMHQEYAAPLRSAIADVANGARGPAGAITAAMFLKEFTGGLPWAHLDIAGTAWSDDAQGYRQPGPTGVGVRTLVSLAFALSALGAQQVTPVGARSAERRSPGWP